MARVSGLVGRRRPWVDTFATHRLGKGTGEAAVAALLMLQLLQGGKTLRRAAQYVGLSHERAGADLADAFNGRQRQKRLVAVGLSLPLLCAWQARLAGPGSAGLCRKLRRDGSGLAQARAGSVLPCRQRAARLPRRTTSMPVHSCGRFKWGSMMLSRASHCRRVLPTCSSICEL